MAYRRLNQDYFNYNIVDTEDEDERIRSEEPLIEPDEIKPFDDKEKTASVNDDNLSGRSSRLSGRRPRISLVSDISDIRKSLSELNEHTKASQCTLVSGSESSLSNRSTAKRKSVNLPALQVTEQFFFELVDQGDVEKVKEFLQESSIFNINCTNYEGQTALHIAMTNRHFDMVNFLLQQEAFNVTDCALHAIRLNQPSTLVQILERLRKISPDLEFSGCVYSPDFAMNMTPLITAAQYGNYEIIEILMARGHVIPTPHKPCCRCKEECLKLIETEDSLLMTMGLLDVYRAISNPAYICQISDDPILYAFQLNEELLQCADVHNVFRTELLKIADDVKQFAADLVSCCRSCEEVYTILARKQGCRLRADLMFPRLILAMNLKQKEFVAAKCVQQVLEVAMIGKWHQWKCYGDTVKFVFFLPRILLLPVIMFLCIFAPHSATVRHYSLPINRYISHLASYALFLFLLFLQCNRDKTDQRKRIDLSGLEIPIFIFALSTCWRYMRLCILQGNKRYFRNRWNLYVVTRWAFALCYRYNIATSCLFILHYMFFIAAYIEVMRLSEDEKELERKYWHYMDSQLIAEALLSIATIMAFFKLVFHLQLYRSIGPLQIALGKMLNDVLKYAVLFLIVIMSFNAGLGRFYNYYSGMSQLDPDTRAIIRQELPFTEPLDTLKFLFWGLFSNSDPESVNVVIETIQGEGGIPVVNEHYLTQAVGYYAFALYMLLTVIVILNMMIGTMANTHNQVMTNVTVEWVYGQTEIYLSCLQHTVLPPPFNILPINGGLNIWDENFTKAPCRVLTGANVIKDPETVEIEIQRDQDFPKLMTSLVQRYFRNNTNRQEKIYTLP